MEFKGFDIFKKKEVKAENETDNREAPVPPSAQQYEAGFKLRLGMLKREIDSLGKTEGSTLFAVTEDLKVIDDLISGMKNDSETELLNKLLGELKQTSTELRASIDKEPNDEREKAFNLVNQYIEQIK
jgi:hypothetical protein